MKNYIQTLALLFLAALAVNRPLKAQSLGGIPDKTFNPGDSGLAVVPLNRSNQRFYPGPEAGIFVSAHEKFVLNGTLKNQLQRYNDYYAKDGFPNLYTPYNIEPVRVGEVMEAGYRNYYKVTNWISGSNPMGTDSLIISRLVVNKPKTMNVQNAFSFNKPLKGDYRTGVEQISPTRLVFWLTHHPGDSVGNLPHPQTYLRSLDTSGAPQALTATLSNFRAVKASYAQGKIYFLGFDVNALPNPTAKIVVVDANTLGVLPQSFPGLNPLLMQGNVQVFKVLDDGKMLIAGSLFNGSFGVEQALRLNADGSPDNTFAASVFANNRTKWVIDASNTIRCGNIRRVGQQLQAAMGIVQPNGGITVTAHAIPSELGLGQCVMYHPDYNAFLFETNDIRPSVRNPHPRLDFSIQSDSLPGSRHRFYVGFNGSRWPLVSRDGVAMFAEHVKLDVNPTISNRFLVFGDFTQVNQRLMPGLAILKANGQLDTTFQSTMRLPDDSLKYSLFYGTHNAHLTNSGKVLISYPVSRTWMSYTGRLLYQDTLRRLMPDGSRDLSYSQPWHHGTLARGKDGKYYSFRFYLNGQPAAIPPNGPAGTVKLLVLDEEGNFLEERGAFTSNGAHPDTNEAFGMRYRDYYFQDDAGGVWINTQFSVLTNGSWGNRQYFIRFDPNGSARAFSPSIRCRTTPLRVEILPGKRMRWTGAFSRWSDTTMNKIVYNIVETDSLGQEDMSVEPKQFFVPDRFGGRNRFYSAPLMYLPDGKILNQLNFLNTDFGNVLVRLQASGKQDNSFMPIEGVLSGYYNSIKVLGDRLLLGVYNFNLAGYQYTPRISFVTNSFKNGVHAFGLKSIPANTGFIQGRVTQVVSPATGCNPGVAQKPANGMLIRTAPSNRMALTDTGGYYSIPVLVGNHTLNQQIENNFLQRQVCPVPPATGFSVAIPSGGTASLGNDFINQTFDCPRLDLKIVDPRFRLCSKTRFSIFYQNDGVAPQPNARIRLNLPEEIRILDATRPFTKDVDSSYVFDLGTLAPGQYGQIITTDTIACPAQPDSLARACFSARIEPLSLCSNIDPASIFWDGAWLDAVARYSPVTNKVRVVVYNKGNSMADSSTIRLTGPGVVYRDGKFKLAGGDSLVTLADPAIIGSIQLRLQQPAGCPLGSLSSLNHSGRGLARAFLNFGPGLLETYTVQACPVFRFSYDPNEKLVEPSGEIEPGTELNYTIHFENYGNDTAYAVSIEDSLPPGLDVTTIQPGASSHKYQLELAGDANQPVLYFHFREIKLTGKKQDSVLSKGQVSFKIRSKDDVVRGSTISNRAHIYFDRNAAVITEYIHSPIAQLGVLSTTGLHKNPVQNLLVAPNPTRGSAKVWFSNPENLSGIRTLQVLTLDGKLLHKQRIADGSAEIKGLPPGLYILKTEGTKPVRLIVTQ